jgi:hypothetical protein
LGEFGHPFKAVSQLGQIPSNVCKLGLPRQAPERIRDVAVMLAPRLMVVACHASPGTQSTFNNLPNIGLCASVPPDDFSAK